MNKWTALRCWDYFQLLWEARGSFFGPRLEIGFSAKFRKDNIHKVAELLVEANLSPRVKDEGVQRWACV